MQVRRGSLFRRFATGSIWSAAASFGSQASVVIAYILLARLTEKSLFGQIVAIQSTVSLFAMICVLGMGSTVTRYTAALFGNENEQLDDIIYLSFTTVCGVSIPLAAAIFLFRNELSAMLFDYEQIALSLGVAALALPFVALDTLNKSILIGREAMSALASVTIIAAFISVPLLIGFTLYFGVLGAAIAILLNSVISLALSWLLRTKIFSVELIRISWRALERSWSIFSKFALPALLASLVVAAPHWIIRMSIANGLEGFAELAVLGVTMQWFYFTIFLPGTVSRATLPIVTERHASSDATGVAKIVLLSSILSALSVLPFIVLVWMMPGHVEAIYGDQFSGTASYFLMACLAGLLYAAQIAISSIFAAREEMWLGFLLNAIWALTFLILFYQSGAQDTRGALFSLLFAYLINFLLSGLYFVRTTILSRPRPTGIKSC